MNPESSFADQYGQWAIIFGASEGVGERFAHTLANRGLNLLLLSRRQDALDRIANAVRSSTGVETRTLAVDLTLPDAVEKVITTSSDLEVGMVIYCAGADPAIRPFRDRSLKSMTDLVQRNCVVPLALCHHFAPLMEDRGKGGIILLSSGAGLQGIKHLTAYCASKAFDIVMAESLWAELHDAGVNVLSLVLTTTDTPAYRETMRKQGIDPSTIEGLVPPQQVVDEALDNLNNGPTWFVSERFRAGEKQLRAMTRNEVVKAISSHPPAVTDD